MPDDASPILTFQDVARDYHSLRPLRVRRFNLQPRETVAILGMDRAAAEAFVNLASAATLPDTGTVTTLGQPTADITSNDAWVGLLDRVGILSERSVLLGEMSAAQNLAMPYSLDVFELAEDLKARVTQLAGEVGIPAEVLATPAAQLQAGMRARLRLGRALAAAPSLLLAEHPNALVEENEVSAFGDDLLRVIAGRRMAAVVLTADRSFARQVASSVLVHNPATGELLPSSLWRRWFS